MASSTGLSKHSGFWEYPLWCFDEEKLKEMGEEAYKIYSDAYDQYMTGAQEDLDEDNDADIGMSM